MANALREVPRVKVVSRHREDCKKKAKGSTYLRCDCPKSLYWCEAGGKPSYESASTNDYQSAERRAREKEAGFAAVAAGEAEPEQGKPVREAVDEFIQSKKDIGLDAKSVDKLALLLGRLADFCERNAIGTVADIKVTHLEKWRSGWATAKSTNRKLQGYTVGFFKWCEKRDYAPKNEAAKLEPIKDGGTTQKRALTDAQFQIALDAVPLLKINHGKSLAQFRALMLLQRWAGLSIQDAVTRPRNHFKRDADGFYSLFLRREKTGVPVYATLPPAIGDEIVSVVNANPDYLFWDGKQDAEAAAQSWGVIYARLAKLDAVAGLKDEQGQLEFTSHILRHSFAAYLFLQGMDVTDVAKLMGHSNTKITEAHYSGWIATRQVRLNDRSKEAYRRWEASQVTTVPLTQ